MRLWFSTGVMTLQKAMLGRNAFSPSEARCALRVAHDIRRFRADVAFANGSIGTELLAHREKIEVTRHGSLFERSPVPMGRAHRHHTRAFCALPRRMLRT